MANVDSEEETPWHYYFLLVMFIFIYSLSYSVQFVCMESSIIMVVEESHFGIAMGVKNVFLYLTFVLVPLINSAIIDDPDDLPRCYTNYTLAYIGLSLVPVGFSLAILKSDQFRVMDQTYEEFVKGPAHECME